MPVNRSTPILYYNKDRFVSAGLDPEKPPTTWAELRGMAVSLTSGDQYAFQVTNSAWVFESLVWSNGGELVVDGKPAFAEAGAGPLQLWADMVHLDGTARFSEYGSGDFASGRSAMAVDSSMVLHWIHKNPKVRVGAAFLPTTVGGTIAVPTGGGAAVIPSAISRGAASRGLGLRAGASRRKKRPVGAERRVISRCANRPACSCKTRGSTTRIRAHRGDQAIAVCSRSAAIATLGFLLADHRQGDDRDRA